jgi:predicted PurR-regulated permease PerM
MTAFQVFRNTLIVLITLGLAYVFLLTLKVWIILLVSILIASALRPPIRWLRKTLRLPQGIAILIVYGSMTFVVITLLVAVFPPVINQFVGFIQNDNRLADRIITAQYWTNRLLSQSTGGEVGLEIPPDDIRAAVRDFVEQIRITAPTLIVDIGNFIGDFVLILVMGIYWVTSRERAEKFLVDLLPLTRQAQATAILDEIESGLGAYVRGIVVVSLIVGVISFVAMTILRVPGAATLSFIYASVTAVPIIGGFVGIVLATGLIMLTSPSYVITVFVVIFLTQQLENYVLSPRIMSKNVDFDEILVIVFIAAGFTLNGVAGGLLAIPVAGTVAILLKHLIFEPRKARVAPAKIDGGILLQEQERIKARSDGR